jgi:hypothetical protein
MFEPTLVEKAKREGLKGKRDMLFAEYLKSPSNTRLAVEIKMLDDDIAESAARMEHREAGRNASKQTFGTAKRTATLR